MPTPSPASTLPQEATSQPTPSPAPTNAPQPAATTKTKRAIAPSPSPSAAADRKIAFLLGATWSCTTYAGTKLTHRFEQSKNGSTITVESSVALPSRVVTLREKYVFDVPSRRWSTDVSNGALTASAPEWTNADWTFTGISVADGAAQRVEMVFAPSGNDGFERTFRHLSNGHWTPYAGETCRRPPQRSR